MVIGGLLAAWALFVLALSGFWPIVFTDTAYESLQRITASPRQVRLIAYRDRVDRTVIGSADLSAGDARNVTKLLRSGRFFFPAIPP